VLLIATVGMTLVASACNSGGSSTGASSTAPTRSGSSPTATPTGATSPLPSFSPLPEPSPSLVKGVSQSIPVGLGPNGLTFAFGSIWVANHHDGSVSRVDPKTGTTIATIPAGNGPGYVSSGFGSIWVTDYFENAISRIDPKTNTSVHIDLGASHGPGNTGCSVVAAFGMAWVGDGYDVLRMDPATNKVIGSTRLQKPDQNNEPCVLQQGGGLVWSHGPGGKAYGLDAQGKVKQVLPYGNIGFGHGMEWVEKLTPDLRTLVIRLDPHTGKPVWTTATGYGDPYNDNFIVSPGRVWLMNEGVDTLYAFDATTGRIVQTVDTPGIGGMPAFGDGSVWLPVFDQNAVWKVDPS
jgi:YVTN family beta-propeller protein